VSKVSSAPPPPPVSRAVSAPPPPVSKAGEGWPEVRALQDELREVMAHRDRLRLRTLRQDERIAQLQADLAAQTAEVGRLGQALAREGSTAELTDLKRVQGIGPAFERALRQQGVTSLEMIAAWSEEEAVEMARRIGTTPHRIQRDGWVRSARELLGLPPIG
jgi:predicted flap endonuclease-1-like 5' DNA nuclease